MTVLVHICCAHCLLAVKEPLRQQGLAWRGLFYNPNIQPFIEFRRRLKAVKVLAESLDIRIDYETHRPDEDWIEEKGLDNYNKFAPLLKWKGAT